MGLRWSSLMAFCCAAVVAGALAGLAQATELYDAARARDAGRILSLLKSGADPNERSPYDGPLHVAARFGPVEAVTGLLDSGADIELEGYGGVRPLHAAVLAGQENIASVLLERGAKVDSTDGVGRTPLLSLMSGRVAGVTTLKNLLESGANPNLLDETEHFHALDYAVIQGRADAAEILLAFGADANAKDNLYSRTPLHLAIAYCVNSVRGNSEVVRILIGYGADVNAKDSQGLTPLQYAKIYTPNNGVLLHMLVKAGAK